MGTKGAGFTASPGTNQTRTFSLLFPTFLAIPVLWGWLGQHKLNLRECACTPTTVGHGKVSGEPEIFVGISLCLQGFVQPCCIRIMGATAIRFHRCCSNLPPGPKAFQWACVSRNAVLWLNTSFQPRKGAILEPSITGRHFQKWLIAITGKSSLIFLLTGCLHKHGDSSILKCFLS